MEHQNLSQETKKPTDSGSEKTTSKSQRVSKPLQNVVIRPATESDAPFMARNNQILGGD